MDNTWLKFVKSQTKSNLQVRHDDQTDQIPKEYDGVYCTENMS